MPNMKLALSDDEIRQCFSVMRELRQHLTENDFLPRVKYLNRMTGMRIAFLADDGEVKSVAGFRIGEWLALDGKYLEIEDLATKNGEQSKGYGGKLFDWLVAYAKQNGCTHLRLVSNVVRIDAHRFYERKGMNRTAHYFLMKF